MIGLHESHKSGAVGNVGRTPVIDRKTGGHSDVGRWLTMLAVPLLTCGGMGVAHAGQWEWRVVGDYTGSYTSTWNGVASDGTTNDQIETWGGIEIQIGSNNGYLAEAKANGTFGIKFTWKPDYYKTLATDPPPGNLTALISSSVETDVQSYGYYGPTGVVEAEDGLGGTTTITDYDPPGAYRDASCWSGRLYTLPVDPTTGIVTFGPFHFNAKASANAPIFGAIGCLVSAGFGAQVDNRKVALSRFGAINETYDPYTNTTTGDTTYSYMETSSNWFPTSKPNDQHFETSLSGNWSGLNGGTGQPDIDWQWSWSQPNMTRTWNHKEMPYGSLEFNFDDAKWVGTPTAPSNALSFSYTVKDRVDYATATAHYVLRVHDAIEKDSEWNTIVTASGPLWGSDPDSNAPSNSLWVIVGEAAAASREFTKGHSSSSGWSGSLAVQGDLSVASVEIPLNIGGEYHSDHSADASGSAYSPYVPPGWFVYPIFSHHYNRKYTYFRHYTTAGEHILPKPSPYDSNPLHSVVKDDYAGSDLSWSAPQDGNTTQIPTYPTTLPATTPNP